MAIRALLRGVNSPQSIMSKVFKRDKRAALLVATRPEFEYQNVGKLFVDENGSPDLAVDASLGGTPDVIYTDAASWTGSALSGTWDAASTTFAQEGTQSLDATSTGNEDEYQFERSTSISAASYKAISGYIYITRWDLDNNSVSLRLREAGVDNGTTVFIEDYVSETTLDTWQKFVIPLSAFGVLGDFDQLVIQTLRTSGRPPNYYLDNLNVEQSGTKVFTLSPDKDKTFEYNSIQVTFGFSSDTYATVAGSTENATTAIGLDPAKFANITTPAGFVGVVFIEKFLGETRFASIFRNNGDIIASTFNRSIAITAPDGSSTVIKFIVDFTEYNVIDANRKDELSLILSDDFSSLDKFQILYFGREKVAN